MIIIMGPAGALIDTLLTKPTRSSSNFEYTLFEIQNLRTKSSNKTNTLFEH